jgi:HlyD family secretion protein
MSEFATGTEQSVRRTLLFGGVLVLALCVGLGGWAATTQISGAVVAAGSLVVDSNVKKVQHAAGGIVGAILARDGQRVRAGDVLVRLDDTITRAGLQIVARSLDELTARKARLEAERDGAEEIAFPEDWAGREEEPAIAHLLAGERNLFGLRRAARGGQKMQLTQRIEKMNDEIAGQTAQEAAKRREIELITRELTGVQTLWKKKLTSINRVTLLEREAARIEGERAQLSAAIAQAQARIAETELQIIQIDRDLGSEVGKELREIEGKIGELKERRVAAEDQLKRIDIRAPQDGVVHQSTAHTVGGVVSPGEPIMLIVPEADSLIAEVRIAPEQIDQVRLGQAVVLRFPSLNQRTTPEIAGAVGRVSADTTTDQRTGLSFYTVRIAMPPEEVAKLGAVTLLSGMPVEALVQTQSRTVLSYLVKPLQDQLARALRER